MTTITLSWPSFTRTHKTEIVLQHQDGETTRQEFTGCYTDSEVNEFVNSTDKPLESLTITLVPIDDKPLSGALNMSRRPEWPYVCYDGTIIAPVCDDPDEWRRLYDEQIENSE